MGVLSYHGESLSATEGRRLMAVLANGP
jgi:hypothetical protein